MSETLSSQPQQDGEFNAEAYIEHTRGLLRDKQVFPGRNTSFEHKDRAGQTAEESKQQLETEYKNVMSVLEFFNQMGLTNQVTDLPVVESFAKKVETFSVLTDRAAAKGLLDTPLASLAEEKRQVVYDELVRQYKAINLELAGESFALTKTKLQGNPMLYQSAESIAALTEKFPNVPESLKWQVVINSPMNPEARLAQAIENSKGLHKKYPDIPPGLCLDLAIDNRDPETALKKALKVADELGEAYPDLLKSTRMQIAINNPKNPEKTAAKVQQNQKILTEKFSDTIPKHLRTVLALGYRSNPVEAAQALLKRTAKLIEKYPEIEPGYLMEIASNNPNNSTKAAKKYLEEVANASAKHSDASMASIRRMVLKHKRDIE